MRAFFGFVLLTLGSLFLFGALTSLRHSGDDGSAIICGTFALPSLVGAYLLIRRRPQPKV